MAAGRREAEEDRGQAVGLLDEPTTLPAISLWQPWASLIALGAKTIETRSWRAPARLIGQRIAIHATASIPSALGLGRRGRKVIGDYEVEKDAAGLLLRGPIAWPYRLPLGAVVATADLVDCVPIHVEFCDCPLPRDGVYLLQWVSQFTIGTGLFDATGAGYRHPHWSPDGGDYLTPQHPRQQYPYGDYRCGRWAWLLDNVEPDHHGFPAKGKQGIWTWTDPRPAASQPPSPLVPQPGDAEAAPEVPQ